MRCRAASAKRGEAISSRELRVNEQIRARQVRVIDDSGQQLGILSLHDALRAARERSLDLVEVSPNVQPPVCRLMDYGRWKYNEAKKERESRARRKTSELREVKVRPKIDEHDYQVKSKMVKRLLAEGDKVKVTLMFRGREVLHTHLALKLLERIFTDVADMALIEKKPTLEGRNMAMVLAPKPGVGASRPDKPSSAEARPQPQQASSQSQQAS
ncbi:MAG TPA: translation initiation factor IF-3 [Candidatus Nitrosotenuis sp.]|nr:translation initiation factor IF-3 [Candidatus Nitrosotenuis sp.]